MPNEGITTGTEYEELKGLEGKERAVQEIEIANRNARTIGDVREGIEGVLENLEVDDDQQAVAVVEEHSRKVDDVAEGYDHVQVEDFGGGKLGENQVGTHNSKVDRDLFSVDAIEQSDEQTEEVILHEDGDANGDVGHADQQVREALAIDHEGSQDGVLEGAELLEGENEAGLSLHLRGSVDAARAGQPHELYGTGQKKVAPHYETIKKYVRNGADRIDTQAEIFKRSGTSRERMELLMGTAGYDDEEQAKVLEKTGELAKAA